MSMLTRTLRIARIALVALVSLNTGHADESQLVGHWKLQGDCRDHSAHGNHGVNHGVDWSGGAAGAFDGVGDYIEAPMSDSLRLGASDFTISAWIHTEEELDYIVGDVVDIYDPDESRGITLTIDASAGGIGRFQDK